MIRVCRRSSGINGNNKECVRHNIQYEIATIKHNEGCNHWKTLIIEACCNTVEVFDYLYNNVAINV